jgi:hypothetical protein
MSHPDPLDESALLKEIAVLRDDRAAQDYGEFNGTRPAQPMGPVEAILLLTLATVRQMKSGFASYDEPAALPPEPEILLTVHVAGVTVSFMAKRSEPLGLIVSRALAAVGITPKKAAWDTWALRSSAMPHTFSQSVSELCGQTELWLTLKAGHGG